MTSSDQGLSGKTGKSQWRRSIGPTLAASALVLTISAGVGAYLARGSIAEALARDWLSQYGIASHLKVRSLSLTGLSAGLTLGAGDDPDLTVERLDVGYGISGPWNGAHLGLQTHSLRLVRPHLKARLSDGRINLGSLQPLVDQLARRPAGAGRTPDLIIEDGVVILDTPQGALTLRGSGTLKGGSITVLTARADPFRLKQGDVQLSSSGSAIQARQDGKGLSGVINLGAVTLQRGESRLMADRVLLTGHWPKSTPMGWVGPVQIDLSAFSVSLRDGRTTASGGAIDARFDGAMSASAEGQGVNGRMLISGQVGALANGKAHARKVRLRVELSHLRVNQQSSTILALGDGVLNLQAEAADQGGVFALKTSQIQLNALRLADQDGQVAWAADLDGGLSGNGGFDAASARRLSHSLPADQDAVEKALRSFTLNASHIHAHISDREQRLTPVAPVSLVARSGATLTLTMPAAGVAFGHNGAGGAATLDLAGGNLPHVHLQASDVQLSAMGVRADLSAHATLNAGMVGGAELSLNGHLAEATKRLQFDLAGCATERVQRVSLETVTVKGVSVRLCPDEGPLVSVGPLGWTAHGRLEDVEADLTGVDAGIRAASGSFAARGKAGVDAATVMLARGALVDTAAIQRFKRISVNGRLGLLGGRWAGDFAAMTQAGRPIGKVHVTQNAATGAGRAEIDARAMAFAPGGLQPGELSPAADFARDAEGPASFTGWFAWRPGAAMTDGGELSVKALKFTSPVGAVLGIDAHLHFTSLAPLVTAPDQRLNIALVNTVTPLSTLSAQFDLGAHVLTLDAANSAFAQGRIYLEPTTAALTPGASVKTALVLDQVNIGQIIAASSLADSVKMDAVVSGRVPFEVGPSGLKILNGQLMAVKPGRLSIARKALGGVTAATSAEPGSPAKPAASPQANVGEDLAFQAMENLAFDQLSATLTSLPDDRLGIIFHIKGRHDPPQRQRASIAVNDLLRGQPLAKPLLLPSDTQINLTLDTSLNFGQLVQALGQAWRNSTGGDSEPQRSDPVQQPGPRVPVK